MGSATVYAHLAGSRIRSHVQYRVAFVVQVVGALGMTVLEFLQILIIFHHIPHLAGWSLAEVSFLYGSSYITFKTADMLMTNLDRLPELIRMGTMDQILTRPLGSLGQVLTGDIDIRHIGGVVQGAAVFVWALTRLDVQWTPARGAVFVSMLVSGVAIFSAIWIAGNAVAFWTTDSREVANSFTYGGQFLIQHPIDILGTWMRRLMAYVIPLAFVNYFPARYVLDRSGPGADVLAFLSPAVAGVSLGAAALVWRWAVRHYRSTGS